MKKIKKLMIMIFISVILTGCVKYNITIDFSDGEFAYLQSTLLIKESDLKSYDMTIDSIKEQFMSSSELLNSWTIEETSQTIDNEKYIGFIMTAPDAINKELTKNFSYSEEKDIITYQLNINFIKSGLDLSELKNYKSTLSTLKTNDATFEMIIKMPGQVTESSLGQIDNDTVTIDMYEYLINGGIPDLKITSQENTVDAAFSLYVAVGIVIIVFLILISYWSKKKRKKDI